MLQQHIWHTFLFISTLVLEPLSIGRWGALFPQLCTLCVGKDALFDRKKKPHPQPLSEWRGEWKLLFADEGGVSLRQGKALLYARKRPLQMEERLMSFLWRRGVGEMLALLAKERTPTSGSLDPYLLMKWIIVWYLQILQFMRNFALS